MACQGARLVSQCATVLVTDFAINDNVSSQERFHCQVLNLIRFQWLFTKK